MLNNIYLSYYYLQMTSTSSTSRILATYVLLLVWNVYVIPHADGQSNYASHANHIGYRGEGLPEEATLDGKVSSISSKYECINKNSL